MTSHYHYDINGTDIIIIGFKDISAEEAAGYLNKAREASPNETITELFISDAGNGEVELNWTAKPPHFQRVRRITGYLVHDLTQWNNAKRAEERERVKHRL